MYLFENGMKKRFEVPKRRSTFPKPHPQWQAEEYERVMYRPPPPPPPEEEAWQWDYDGRKKALKEAFVAHVIAPAIGAFLAS
jgi:hypothetical protein